MAKSTRRFTTAKGADKYLTKSRKSGKRATIKRDATRGSKKPYIVTKY